MAGSVTDEELKRSVLFTPLESKQALHDWILVFLGLDFPDCVVADYDGQNPSNSSPMDLIWEVYSMARRNDPEQPSRIMAYASRDSFKSLGASVLEVLSVLHLGRDVGHMAAIESQSQNVQKYVREFFQRPMLRDFVVGNNKETIEIVRYFDGVTGESLCLRDWALLPEVERARYRRIQHSIKILICTMAGANSWHGPFMCVDEIDVVPDERAYRQAKLCPAPREGKLPITLLTSTRKSGVGLVQRELDRAQETGLLVRHWNIIDVTERCPASRHRPDLPKLPIYRSDDTLRACSETDYKSMPDEEQKLYQRDEGFAGCLKNCKLFAVCRGRLATHQKSTSPLLRPISTTQNRYRESEAELFKAELMCWKPSSEGLVYPRFNPEIHVVTAAQMAEKITGEPYSTTQPRFTKGELLKLIAERDMRWYAGMDFGYTHNFAVTLGARDGNRLFVTHCIAAPELDPAQMVQLCQRTIKEFEPAVYADPENPGEAALLKKAGFSIRSWQKGKGSVVKGIQIVRAKLMPTVGEPQLYFLRGDAGVELLCQRMLKYHWKQDAAGVIYDEPDDANDDECDSLRYLVMNVFSGTSGVTVADDKERGKLQAPIPMAPGQSHHQYTAQDWMQQTIAELTGQALTDGDAPAAPASGRKGKFVFNI